MANATVTVGEKKFVFDRDRFMNVELMAVERETGMTSLEWQVKLTMGSVTAATALVWLLRKRHGEPQLRFDEVEFDMEDLTIDLRDEDEEQAGEPGKDPAPQPEPPAAPPVQPAGALSPFLSSQTSTAGNGSLTPSTTTGSSS